jgi:hypothetical protein
MSPLLLTLVIFLGLVVGATAGLLLWTWIVSRIIRRLIG